MNRFGARLKVNEKKSQKSKAFGGKILQCNITFSHKVREYSLSIRESNLFFFADFLNNERRLPSTKRSYIGFYLRAEREKKLLYNKRMNINFTTDPRKLDCLKAENIS